METKRIISRISKTESWSFEKMHKVGKTNKTEDPFKLIILEMK